MTTNDQPYADHRRCTGCGDEITDQRHHDHYDGEGEWCGEYNPIADDAPATPNHPALAALPGPLNEDGTPQTLKDIEAELPAGADGVAVDVSLRNLMTAPQKTLALIARKAYEYGVEGRPYVHHAVATELGDGSDTIRILLLTADEPRSEEALAREQAEREARAAKAATAKHFTALGRIGKIGRKR